MGTLENPEIAAGCQQSTKDDMYERAIEHLQCHAEICEHNAPIQESEGRAEDAENSRLMAESYRFAIERLRLAE